MRSSATDKGIRGAIVVSFRATREVYRRVVRVTGDKQRTGIAPMREDSTRNTWSPTERCRLVPGWPGVKWDTIVNSYHPPAPPVRSLKGNTGRGAGRLGEIAGTLAERRSASGGRVVRALHLPAGHPGARPVVSKASLAHRNVRSIRLVLP